MAHFKFGWCHKIIADWQKIPDSGTYQALWNFTVTRQVFQNKLDIPYREAVKRGVYGGRWIINVISN